MQRDKLHEWLNRTLYGERAEGPCVKLVLRHISVGGQSSKDGEVFSMEVSHNDECVTIGEDELLIIVNDIESASHGDAEGLGGIQRYRLLAYFKHETRPLARFTFRMTGSDNDEDEIGLSEAPTNAGVVGQMMRHNEALMRTAVMGANQSLGILNRTVSTQAEQIEELVKERRKNFEMMEDLRSQSHERDLSTQESLNRETRHAQLFEKAQLLLPALVNRLSGKKLLPEDATPAEEMVQSFSSSLDSEQMQKLMTILKPEQQIAIVELIEHANKRDAAAEENKTKLLARSTNGRN